MLLAALKHALVGLGVVTYYPYFFHTVTWLICHIPDNHKDS